MERIIKNLDELDSLAEELLNKLQAYENQSTILALSGDLGAGKTTLVQVLAKKLGVTEVVTSPTFTIMKQYELTDQKWDTLVHMDAYRIESDDELKPLQFEMLLKVSKTLVCIEWAERIKQNLPGGIVYLRIEIGPNEGRTVTLSH